MKTILGVLGAFCILALLHVPLLRLPYFWDEAGYYVPAALDLYAHGLLVPRSTPPVGHTPLVMIYLGLAWRIFGFSTLVTRAAMILMAAAAVVALWKLARLVAPARSEVAAWSASLLALSPLFFAQSCLALLDLTVALFTTLAVAALLGRRNFWFAAAASFAVLSKETAVVLLPAVWLLAAWRWREKRIAAWLVLSSPLLPLIAWTLYYRHSTGFWTGNAGYLQYNLYSTLRPSRIVFTCARRLYEIFIAGFNWLLAGAAAYGFWWARHRRVTRKAKGSQQLEVRSLEPEARRQKAEELVSSAPPLNAASRKPNTEHRAPISDFFLLTAALTVAYLVMLSVVGGAVLPRYLLPVFPVLYLAATVLVFRLPRMVARTLLVVVLACFVAAWFVNPPYPFPFEDNLAYADFIRLHQQAARFLENRKTAPRVLTAWPASDELSQPNLGYVSRPLKIVPMEGFTEADFAQVDPGSFDVLMLYSRKWEPSDNWLTRFPLFEKMRQPYFDYTPQAAKRTLAVRFHLKPIAQFQRRGQWVVIYGREN